MFALAPLPWLVRAITPARRVASCAIRVPFGDRLLATVDGKPLSTQVSRHWLSTGGLVIVWLLLLFSMARPQWLKPPVTKNLPTRDLLLLVDLSGSMRQEDFSSETGQRVDRLTAVKQVLGDFLERREGDRVGLVVFGDSPFLQAPFSDDLEMSRRLLDETDIGMAGPRTSFGDAIGLGISLFDASEAPAKTIIALTDGNDTASQVPPTEASRVARERGIRIHTVAIGDPTTVGEEKLDEVTLREVATQAGGSYFFAADRQQLAGIYDELDRIETRQIDVISHRPRKELYFWPLLAALAIWMAEKLFAGYAGHRLVLPTQAIATIRVNPVTGELKMQ
jgi:Ca-activated chloride channel family protein